jgi:SRSO17 transposase
MHGWIAGDDEMGASHVFSPRFEGSRPTVSADGVREHAGPRPRRTSSGILGTGRHPKNPFLRVEHWREALPAEAWTRIEVRDGEKGPLMVEVVKRRVRARNETSGEGPDEMLFITREFQANKTYKLDYYLSNAGEDVPLAEFSRVAKAAHRIEECFEWSKGEAGLAAYQVRNWASWHRHQTLSMLAAWSLNEETRWGKKSRPPR